MRMQQPTPSVPSALGDVLLRERYLIGPLLPSPADGRGAAHTRREAARLGTAPLRSAGGTPYMNEQNNTKPTSTNY